MPTRREILMSTGALAGVSMLPANAKLLASAVQDDVPIPGSVDKALNIWDLKAMAKERLPKGTLLLSRVGQAMRLRFAGIGKGLTRFVCAPRF